MVFTKLARRAAAKAVASLCWIALTAAVFGCSSRVLADCLASTDPGIRALQALSEADAVEAVRQAGRALSAELHAKTPDSRRIASLYGVLAQSYSRLELDADARAAARKGLALALGPRDPVRLDLLAAYAENVYDNDGIQRALKTIESARSAQPAGSLASICLQITQGMLEYRLDHTDRAIVSLTQAYGATGARGLAEPRMFAADALTAVMRAMGDYSQALALNNEVIAWDVAHKATLSLSVSRYVRGTILKLMGDYRGAIEEFAQSRTLSVPLHDVQGIAFEDLRICETRVEVGDLNSARSDCNAALPTFIAAGSTDVVKETRATLARIDLMQGDARRALAEFNGVLDRAGEDLPPRRVAAIYLWRARTNAALNHYRDGYRDLSEYVRRSSVDYGAERIRQAAAMRAKFATDRAMERNGALQRELARSRQRSFRQAQELRRNATVFATGLMLIALLIYISLANIRQRRELVRLATQDGLTGLPNRRGTAERATAALNAAMAAQKPLTLAIIDLDHFKAINDRCGHAAGDHVLREFAKSGAVTLRPTDVFGRWGGEEFLLVMPDTTLDIALTSLERLRRVLAAVDLPASGADLRLSLSAGLATMDEHAKSLDEMIACADAALYAAKNQGRDLVRVADHSYLAASTGVRRALRQ